MRGARPARPSTGARRPRAHGHTGARRTDRKARSHEMKTEGPAGVHVSHSGHCLTAGGSVCDIRPSICVVCPPASGGLRASTVRGWKRCAMQSVCSEVPAGKSGSILQREGIVSTWPQESRVRRQARVLNFAADWCPIFCTEGNQLARSAFFKLTPPTHAETWTHRHMPGECLTSLTGF